LLGRVAPWLLREVANATSEPAEARAAEARRPQERPAAERERPSDATVGAPADAAASDAGPVVLPIDASMSENLALTQTLARPRPRPQRGLWASIKPAAAPQPASPASVTSKPLTTPAPAAPSGGDVGELMDPYARKPSQPGRVSALARGLTH
jgi:hypothetical protein